MTTSQGTVAGGTASAIGGSGVPAHDVAGRIEVRGIDQVPESERHGRPRELFWVWAAANIMYLYFVLGGTLVLLGLGLWTSLGLVVVGNLWWVGVGWLATSGPASGTPSVVVTRSQYGVLGNRVFSAGVGWVVAVTYEAVNLALGALAGIALVLRLGGGGGTVTELLLLLAIGAATFTISVYGHATIVRLSPWMAGALAVVIVVLGGYVLAAADWSHAAPPDAATGVDLVAALSVGFVLIASVPLSWLTGADYARYLPSTTSRRAVLGWTAAGGMVPAVVVGVLGVLAGTSIDMVDPAASLAAIVPGWFHVVFLAAVVVGSVANNVLTAYSSGLCLQAMGVRASRARTVVIDGVLATGIAGYALLAGGFLETVSSLLAYTVVLLGPAMGIYATDVALRRCVYDDVPLQSEQRGGPLWGWHGFQPAGLVATVVGSGVALLSVSTSTWVGPLASALGGTDLSLVLGPAVAAAVYAALARPAIVGGRS